MDKNFFKEAIEKTIDFPELLGGGDYNTFDLFWMARGLEDFIDTPLNIQTIDKKKGIQIVETVENEFVKGVLIRTLSKEEIVKRANTTSKYLQIKELLNINKIEALIIALYIWHGCLLMAKTTRIVDAAGQVYTDEIRQSHYEDLKNTWEIQEESYRNPWVKFGVKIAKSLSEKRKNTVKTDWIPEDSPYWS